VCSAILPDVASFSKIYILFQQTSFRSADRSLYVDCGFDGQWSWACLRLNSQLGGVGLLYILAFYFYLIMPLKSNRLITIKAAAVGHSSDAPNEFKPMIWQCHRNSKNKLHMKLHTPIRAVNESLLFSVANYTRSWKALKKKLTLTEPIPRWWCRSLDWGSIETKSWFLSLSVSFCGRAN